MIAPVAVLLAAGEGRRMGGPKGLLVVDDKTLLRAHVERLREVGCRRVVVVVRLAMAETARVELSEMLEVELLATNTASMGESLAAALTRVASSSEQEVIVSPVDTLPARLSTLKALLDAVRLPGVAVATPCYLGRGGHPVVARERLLRAFREGYSGSLRTLIQTADAQRRRVDTADPAVIGDFDTPLDLAALRPGLVPEFAGSS